MTDLVARLREAIDETERIAQAATPGPWRWGDWSATFGTLEQEPYVLERAPGIGPFPAVRQRDEECEEVLRTEPGADEHEANRTHIVRHDPAAVLRRCAADRQILDLYTDYREKLHTTRPEDDDHSWHRTGEGAAYFRVLHLLAEAYGVEA